jgi:hypothetical protein
MNCWSEDSCEKPGGCAGYLGLPSPPHLPRAVCGQILATVRSRLVYVRVLKADPVPIRHHRSLAGLVRPRWQNG